MLKGRGGKKAAADKAVGKVGVDYIAAVARHF